MYRKKFDPQRNTLPDNYCGWAASETDPQPAVSSIPQENGECTKSNSCEMTEPCQKNSGALPAFAEKIADDKDLSDFILIGAILLLLFFQKKDCPKDPAVILPLVFLLLKK